MNRRTSIQAAETLSLQSDHGIAVRAALERFLDQAEGSAGRLSDRSLTAYRQLWRPVIAFCSALRLDLAELGIDELRLLIDGRRREAANKVALTPRYIWRMLRLIDDVALFEAREQGVTPNRSAQQLIDLEYAYANARNQDALPDILSRDEFDRFLKYAIALWPNRATDDAGAEDWREARIAALLSVVLGAGPTPREAADLLLENVRLDDQGTPDRLRIQAAGRKPARDVPIEGWASRILRGWLQVRDFHLRGAQLPQVFPSTRKGGTLDNSTLNLAYRDVARRCGISDISSGLNNPNASTLTTRGPFTFRHTFAIKARAERRYTDDRLMEILGISDEKAFARYRRIVF